MEFHYHEIDRDVLVLEADKDLDSLSTTSYVDELQRLVDGGARKLLVDCSRLGYVSSVGIASLIRLYKRFAEGGGHVMLAEVKGPLARLLEITRLNQVFETHPTIDGALRAFRGHP